MVDQDEVASLPRDALDALAGGAMCVLMGLAVLVCAIVLAALVWSAALTWLVAWLLSPLWRAFGGPAR